MSNENTIEQCLAGIDNDFIKALAEPVRIEILKHLVIHGASDVKDLADKMPQDRSVISRHLTLMAKAGLLSVKKEGRHVIYCIDGKNSLKKSEQITNTIKQCLALGCC